MKKLICTAMCVALFALGGCDYDDTDVWNAIDSQEERIAALEEWQKTANENIAALQAIVNGNDYITGVEEQKEGETVVGYVIHFYRQGDIIIYHGRKGDKGDKGEQGEKGEDGTTPLIGVTQLEDGRWYWTLNNELLTDTNGNPICTSGKDGQDGQPGASGAPGADGQDGASAPLPQLKTGSELGDGYVADAVYLSVDGGETWVKVSGDEGASSAGTPGFITDVTDNGAYYTFTCMDGTTIDVPKYVGVQFIYRKSGEDEGTSITNGELSVDEGTSFSIACTADNWDYEFELKSATSSWSGISRTDDRLSFTDIPVGTIKIIFSVVAEDNKLTQYQITITTKAKIDANDENAALIGALADAGVGTKDAEGNLILMQEEIANTTSLDLSDKHLGTLVGLEVFTNLTKLECRNNQITKLDLAKFPQLTYLDCSDNNLETLNLAETPALTYLNCSGNPLSTLDFSSLTALEELNCSSCVTGEEAPMTRAIVENGTLDLSANINLISVDCSDNQLAELILPPNLIRLYCNDNRLASVDISLQPNLNVLDVSDNLLTGLDVEISKDQLKDLNCSRNALTELDVTLCTELVSLDCQANQLVTLNIVHNTKLSSLACGNQETASGEIQELELILSESLMNAWNTQWQTFPDNTNVIVSDGTLKPGVSGEDFGNGGVY